MCSAECNLCCLGLHALCIKPCTCIHNRPGSAVYVSPSSGKACRHADLVYDVICWQQSACKPIGQQKVCSLGWITVVAYLKTPENPCTTYSPFRSSLWVSKQIECQHVHTLASYSMARMLQRSADTHVHKLQRCQQQARTHTRTHHVN